ncbi:hypothetical protein [Pseudoflavitalea rhizosphaerae]|uniref:hypothetical protein n=1 Tax=Pseudoflavitalea rhizosphaerae TaxID=1884793 RepID=UPI000F8D8CE0|nr:hypothetical protein [Pseudoflavitalea rhizosphaerae]
MKVLISFAFVFFTVVSCKKDKAEFVPSTVESTTESITYTQNLGANSPNWFSATTMDGLSLPEISKDPGLHESIVFGFYNEGETYAFYSPDVFPKMYGQENWITRRSVRFRRSNISFQQFFEMVDKYQENIPVQEILNAWRNGVNEKNHMANFQEGEIWTFQTIDRKITGLMMIQSVNSFFDKIQAAIWVAK